MFKGPCFLHSHGNLSPWPFIRGDKDRAWRPDAHHRADLYSGIFLKYMKMYDLTGIVYLWFSIKIKFRINGLFASCITT
jgi:hypothetical protein